MFFVVHVKQMKLHIIQFSQKINQAFIFIFIFIFILSVRDIDQHQYSVVSVLVLSSSLRLIVTQP